MKEKPNLGRVINVPGKSQLWISINEIVFKFLLAHFLIADSKEWKTNAIHQLKEVLKNHVIQLVDDHTFPLQCRKRTEEVGVVAHEQLLGLLVESHVCRGAPNVRSLGNAKGHSTEEGLVHVHLKEVVLELPSIKGLSFEVGLPPELVFDFLGSLRGRCA